jgi:hypothetical protein
LKAESTKELEMERLKGLLGGAQKEGWLFKLSPAKLKGWQKRYFVLKDNMLAWFGDNNKVDTTKTRPKGVMYVETSRLYKLEEKETKVRLEL